MLRTKEETGKEKERSSGKNSLEEGKEKKTSKLLEKGKGVRFKDHFYWKESNINRVENI